MKRNAQAGRAEFRFLITPGNSKKGFLNQETEPGQVDPSSGPQGWTPAVGAMIETGQFLS